MKRSGLVLAFIIVFGSCAGQIFALEPGGVLVVVNAESPQSVELGEYYIKMRGIPPTNLAKIRTTTDYTISREDYDRQIRLPIGRLMAETGLAQNIKAVVLMWGVPVKVAGPVDQKTQLIALYQQQSQRAHYHLAGDYQMLAAVGKDFPPQMGEKLKPISDLFNANVLKPIENLPSVNMILDDIQPLTELRISQVSQTNDPDKAQLAWRQLAAIHLDLHGIRGLVAFADEHQIPQVPDLEHYRSSLQPALTELAALPNSPTDTQTATRAIELVEQIDGVVGLWKYLQQQLKTVTPPLADSAVDSELALLWWGVNYPLDKWMANPLHWKWSSSEALKGRQFPPVLMTARIDGPSAEDARKIIDNSIRAEKSGLRGVFYVDAGGPKRAAEYDQVLRKIYEFARDRSAMPAVIDETPLVFAEGSCRDAALYVGWYSLQRYAPAFDWVTGAVGWHVSSFEAMNLRDPQTNEWCAKMIQHGVAATVGAVDEPFLPTFPDPMTFFPMLMTGRYTVAECYWRSMPAVSWRVTLIADPLYNPFAAGPAMKPDDLPADLAGALQHLGGSASLSPRPAAAENKQDVAAPLSETDGK